MPSSPPLNHRTSILRAALKRTASSLGELHLATAIPQLIYGAWFLPDFREWFSMEPVACSIVLERSIYNP